MNLNFAHGPKYFRTQTAQTQESATEVSRKRPTETGPALGRRKLGRLSRSGSALLYLSHSERQEPISQPQREAGTHKFVGKTKADSTPVLTSHSPPRGEVRSVVPTPPRSVTAQGTTEAETPAAERGRAQGSGGSLSHGRSHGSVGRRAWTAGWGAPPP